MLKLKVREKIEEKKQRIREKRGVLRLISLDNKVTKGKTR